MPKISAPLRRPSGPERTLMAIVAAVLFVVALVQSLLDRRAPLRPAAAAAGASAGGPVAPGGVRPARPAPTGIGGIVPGIKARLGRLPVIGRVMEVMQRYSEMRGNNLASAVTFQMFISLFPLMLVVVAIVGFVAAGTDINVAGRIVEGLGLTGETAETISNAVATAEKNRAATAPLALIALLWSGLGLVNAFQFAFNQVWQVDERGLKDKGVGLLWLGGAAVLFVASAAVTTVVNWIPGVAAPLALGVGLIVNFGLWLWTFKILPNRNLPWKALVPGALLGAIGMELLKVVGGIYVPRAVANSSELYGSLGVVFAVLAWLLFFGRLSVYAAVLNVVRWEQKVGTHKVTIEVPAGQDVTPTADASRVGRLQRDDIAT